MNTHRQMAQFCVLGTLIKRSSQAYAGSRYSAVKGSTTMRPPAVAAASSTIDRYLTYTFHNVTATYPHSRYPEGIRRGPGCFCIMGLKYGKQYSLYVVSSDGMEMRGSTGIPSHYIGKFVETTISTDTVKYALERQ